jgi:hypothetical protein
MIVGGAGVVVNGNQGLPTKEGQDNDDADNACERFFHLGVGPVPLSFTIIHLGCQVFV